jgi:hypothetical protein
MSSDVPSASAAASVRSPGRGASEARSALAAAKLSSPLYYADYLMLPQLLASQRPLTPSSHELLFITTHQTMELWFKQVLFELAAVRDIFGAVPTPERAVGRACAHLERTNEIFALLAGQFKVLETMSALEFLEFRDRLYPASGFQCVGRRAAAPAARPPAAATAPSAPPPQVQPVPPARKLPRAAAGGAAAVRRARLLRVPARRRRRGGGGGRGGAVVAGARGRVARAPARARRL